MNVNARKITSAVVTLILLAVLIQYFARDAVAHGNRESRLQGTWRVHINPTNCQTGAPIPSFDVLVSAHRGGTLTETMNPLAFLPGQRSVGLGVWSHTRDNTFRGVWDAFILFDSPAGSPGLTFKRGVQRLTWDFQIYGDEASIAATGQFLDANGNVLGNTCATGTGTRFEQEQDDD